MINTFPTSKFFLIVVFNFVFIGVSISQFSEYLMEFNLNDNIGSNDAIYLDENIPTGSPTYISGATGMKVSLAPNEGVQLPLSTNGSLDTMKSIEYNLDFSVSSIGSGSGRKHLICNTDYTGGNAPGVQLFTRHDIFDPNPTFDIMFFYADGGFDQGVPNHPGHYETTLGNFNEGDQINVRLILDFENNKWSALVNGVYSSDFFDPFYDMDVIKETIIDNHIYMGWSENLDYNAPWHIDVYTATAEYDNLKIYSPKQPGLSSILITALNAMTGHVDGSAPLTSPQLDGYLADIFLNYDGNFSAAETEIRNYLTAYELHRDPVLLDRSVVKFNTLDQDAQALIFLQQNIHDQEFVLGNISNMAGLAYEFAEVFPGSVDPAAPRLNGQIAEVLGTYNRMEGARVSADLDDAKRPTGYYAAPGELVTITIPNSLTNLGIKAMIGAHDRDHTILGSGTNRFVRISNEFELNSTSTDIANPFGGAIYIKVPEGSNLGWFDVTIDGAVKSPYFSFRPGRITTLADWQNQVNNAGVSWVDMESDKYMMTLPLQHVAPIADPHTLMDSLNSIMDAYRFLGGKPFNRARSEYFCIDSRLPNGSFGTGYPQIIGDRFSPDGSLNQTDYYPTNILNPDFHKTAITTTYHERGHAQKDPTLVTEVETITQIYATYIFDVLYDLPMDTAFKYCLHEELIMDEAMMDWIISENFRNDNPMDCDPTMASHLCDELRYQHRGHAKYVEMAELFGWSSVNGMNKVFYDEWSQLVNANQLIDPDDIIANASAATGFNMAPLMHFWGLHPSPALAKQLSYMPESSDILNRLQHYKSLVPTNNAAFVPWYNAIKPQKDPVHYPRYDFTLANYDAAFAQEIIDQIDFLIATYFGNSPCDQNVELINTIGSANYQAENWIKASELVHPGANVTMSAFDYVELLGGFETTNNVSLIIDLNGCTP